MGYPTLAIYSEADKELPYIHEADEAVHIGPPPVAQSYLQMDRLIEVAKAHRVTYVHPGYGLLSENADFAQKCVDAGLRFIGPPPTIIRQMGDKITARRLMKTAGIPVVPGMDGGAVSLDIALQQAGEIGYPVMLKASAGGGGIGMSICYDAEQLKQAYQTTKAKANAYFGHDEMFIEKYISNPRHIEVQIAADKHNQCVHLFERECSIQRRHQKVIEESPSPFLTEETRERICNAAVRAAVSAGYVGIGTVEFIVDQDQSFYFLEMNTRIQVEHPVTEAITGLDLVALQLQIEEGEPLPVNQSAITRFGHAIEFRIYAEDPVTFMPSPGKITTYKRVEGPGIRFDDGIEEGVMITPYYDPMIAKLIVSGSNRTEVLQKSQNVLAQLQLEGIKHNVPFLQRVLADQRFVTGTYDTSFVARLTQNENKTSKQKEEKNS